MSDEAGRLIELASQPLANNAELHLAAQGDLRRRLEISKPEPDQIRDAIDAFERADRRPMFRRWRAVFYAVTLVLAVWVIAANVRQVGGLSSMWRSMSQLSFDSDYPSKWKTETLSNKERLLLFGDEGSATKEGKWKSLWDSEPKNPTYLAQYAVAYFNEHKKFSPEIIKAGKLIDPDNGWFQAMIASEYIEGAVTKAEQKPPRLKEITTPKWEIHNPNRLQSSLALIHESVSKPHFRNYEKNLIEQRIPLLPKRTDYASQMVPIGFIATATSAAIPIRKLTDAFCAGAQEAAAKGDVIGFKQIVSDWEKLSMTLTQNGLSLIDLLIAKNVVLGPAENFRDAAQTLGLEEERRRFEELHELKKADKERRFIRDHQALGTGVVNRRGSLLAAGMIAPMLTRMVKDPPVLTDNELRPSRYAHHALNSRGFSLTALLALGIAACFAALHRFRQPRIYRALSDRILDQIRPTDWFWILGCGILAPLSYYVAFIYFSQLSWREWSHDLVQTFQAHSQFLAMVVMMVVLPPLLASWRLSKRGKFIGLETERTWIGWSAVLSAALAIPVSGLLVSYGIFSEWVLLAASLLLVFPLLWILVGCGRNLLSHSKHALRRGTLARMLIPAWVFGVLTMVISVPVHYRMEQHWIQKDRLFEIRAEAPAMSTYEWDVTQQLRAELLEIHP